MNKLTKNMKTVCIGRYLLDIPEQAEFSIGNTEIDSIKIEYNPKPSPNETSFRAKVQSQEAQLRAARHETEGTRLREVLDINGGKQRLLVYREDESDIYLTWIETRVWLDGNEWKISNDAAEEFVGEEKKLVTQLANQIVPRQMNDIPKAVGACVRNGLVSAQPYQRENIIGGMRIEDPAISLRITYETSGPYEPGETLWDRIDRANRMAEAEGAVIKTLRRAHVTVDGRKGQEYVSIFPSQGVDYFDAKAEIYGNATPRVPTFKLQMETNRPSKSTPDDKGKTLSNEEAFALWDAILKSIRPRPGAF